MPKSSQLNDAKVISRIYGHGRGWAFSQSDFTGIASRAVLDATLSRLVKKATIRRVMRGIYEYPRYSRVLGQPLSPDVDQVAQALARTFVWRIQPDGATAQNLLGLSTQVPARAVYLSDGPNRRYAVGRQSIVFKHTALKEASFKCRESGLVVQALKAWGEKRITPKLLTAIRGKLDPSVRKKILRDTRTATGWVYAAIRKIARETRRA